MADPQSSASKRAPQSHRLHFYVKAGDLPGIRYLLEGLGGEERRRILSVPDRKGDLPFHSAARAGHVEVLEAVLPEDQDVNAQSTNGGKSALHIAASHGHLKAVEWLLAIRRADFKVPDEKGELPFHSAARGGRVEVLEAVWPEDQDVNAKSTNGGKSALHFAAGHGHLKAVQWLLDVRMADLKVQDEKGELPFHSAARGGHVEVLEAVLPEGQDVNAKSTNGGNSALHFAAGHGHLKAVQWLFVCRRADLKVEDERGNTPLHLAVLLGHKDVARFLVNEGASLSALNKDRMMAVSYCQDREMFQALLSYHNGSSFNARKAVTSQMDANGRTTLHYAAQYATDREVIATLISGMDEYELGLPDTKGDSFLHVAAKAGNMEVLEALKKLGSDVETPSLISGLHSPGLCALLHNHREFFDELVGMGTMEITLDSIVQGLKVELCDNQNSHTDSTLPTYLALYANKDQVYEFLLETTLLSVNHWDDERKMSCLHWAVVDKRKDIVEKLCKNVYVRPSIQDGDGKTALQHAFEHKDYEMMQILKSRPDFKDHEEKLYRDRDVYVQALNAILVGAALIASVTFAGWLQLPSGAVFTTLALKVFWASNSLSFFLAVATMWVAIGALLPTPTRYVGDIANQLRLAIVLDASLLALSLVAVMWAFAAAGFAALRHSHASQYEASMMGTTVVGGVICTLMGLAFFVQLYRCVPSLSGILLTLLRFVPWPATQCACIDHVRSLQNLRARIGGSSRFGYPNIEIRNAMGVELVSHRARLAPSIRSATPLSPPRRDKSLASCRSRKKKAFSTYPVQRKQAEKVPVITQQNLLEVAAYRIEMPFFISSCIQP